MRHTISNCLSAICLPALFAVGGTDLIQTVAASCSLAWDVNQPTCDVAHNSSQSFEYDITTSWVSQGKGQWTIAFALANPDGGISFHTLDTDSELVDDGFGFDAGVVPNSVTGVKGGAGNRTSVFIAIEDDETPDCSGNRNVTIKPFGGSCP